MCAARYLRLGPIYIPFTLRQIAFWLLLLAGLLLFFCWDYKVFYTVLTFLICAWYGVVVLFRLGSVLLTLIRRALGRPVEHRVTAEEIAALDPATLPTYTVLVPMYREPEVADKIVRAVTNFDYPVEKLDVKLLLEEDDPETRAKVDAVLAQLPPCVEVVVCPKVPKGEPRTKPRACNWGLERAKGDLLVIYDAEDHPESDQLKKAVVVFRRLEAAGRKDVVCLQAKLNYFNAHQNALTRFFTLEYTVWFDLFLPGLHAFRMPIPLGGTSNHFRIEPLRRIGGWDPFNVTEDCDLGLRLARQGHKTQILDSTTWEEANSRVWNWIRQRSRWVKGYFQTHLVHTRDSYWPFLFLSAGFLLLAHLIQRSENHAADRAEALGRIAKGVVQCCYAGAIASGALGLWTLGERLWRRAKRGPSEGRLSAWDAFTSRLCVGWMSMMLILNLFAWLTTGAYLFREPIAKVLPAWTDQYVVDGRYTPREVLRDWQLYHTKVRVEHRAGTTVWNTLWKWLVKREISAETAREMFDAIDPWSFWSQILFPIVVGLFAANVVFIFLNVAACARRNLWGLLPYALLVPFYWVLISFGAIKGAWQLFWNPYYWEKTTHGLTAAPPDAAPRGPSAPPIEANPA